MTEERCRLFRRGLFLIIVCTVVIKLEVLQVVMAQIQDAVADTIVIQYSNNRRGEAWAVMSPDAKQIAYCKQTREFFIQELSTGKITAYPTKDKVYQVKYSPDGKYLVAGRNVLHRRTGQVTTLPTEAYLDPVLNDYIAFSPDGESLAIVSKQWESKVKPSTIEIWNLKNQQLVQKLPIQEFYRSMTGFGSATSEMSFSRDGRYLAVAGSMITLWDVQEGKCVKTLVTNMPEDNVLQVPTHYDAITYSPNGKYIAAAYFGSYEKKGTQGPNNGMQIKKIEIWDTEQGKVVKTLEGGRNAYKLRYSPDGQYLAAGSGVGRGDYIRDAVWLWDITSGLVAKKLPKFPDGNIVAMEYSADGRYLAVSGSWHIKIWKIK